jgi:hypothetical protein
MIARTNNPIKALQLKKELGADHIIERMVRKDGKIGRPSAGTEMRKEYLICKKTGRPIGSKKVQRNIERVVVNNEEKVLVSVSEEETNTALAIVEG